MRATADRISVIEEFTASMTDHRCKKCNRSNLTIFDPEWAGMVISPGGTIHMSLKSDKTACGAPIVGGWFRV